MLSSKRNDKLDYDKILVVKKIYDNIMRFIEPTEETLTEDIVNFDEFLIGEIDEDSTGIIKIILENWGWNKSHFFSNGLYLYFRENIC